MITSNARAEFTTKTTSLFGPSRWHDTPLAIFLSLLASNFRPPDIADFHD